MRHILRKHGNVIMAVLGVFLMIAFSLPTFFSSRNDNATTTVGRLNGKPVTDGELKAVAADKDILKIFDIDLTRLGLLDEQNFDVHWYLLLREAQNYGIVPSEAEITDVVASRHLTDSQLNDILSAKQLTQPELRNSIGHMLMVQRLIDIVAEASPLSVPQMEAFAEIQASTLKVKYIVLDASGVLGTSKAPSEDALQKQFDLYKDVVPMQVSGVTPPEINGHHYPFGYKYADRVQVEYIKFDRSWPEMHFKPTEQDYEEAFRYYQNHRTEFANSDATGTQPAIKPFDQVRSDLVEAQIKTRVDAFLKKVTDAAKDMASVPWKDADTDKGYRKGVMDKGSAGLVSYDKIVKAINSNPEYEGFPVVHGTSTGLLDKRGLELLEGIGKASYTTQAGTFTFPDLALHVKELDPPQGPMTRMYLQEGVEGPLVVNDAGNYYLYRVIQADETHDPATVAEVRPQVIEDFQHLAAYEQAVAQGQELARDRVDVAGAKAGLSVRTSAEFTRAAAGNPTYEPAPGFIEAAFKLVPEGSATQPAATTTAFDYDPALKVYVIGDPDYQPIKPADYAKAREGLIYALQGSNSMDFVRTWLDLDEEAKRLKYVPVEPFKKAGA